MADTLPMGVEPTTASHWFEHWLNSCIAFLKATGALISLFWILTNL